MARPDSAPENTWLLVIGASAGGVEALQRLLPSLDGLRYASCLVVVHLPSGARSILPEMLARRVPVPVRHAVDGAHLEPATVYVCPPDHHLIVEDGKMVLSNGPRQNRHRPSIDALFRSAAATAGPRAIGVVLSGSLRDGSAGLATIVDAGGLAFIQDPNEAAYSGMPLAAKAAVPDAPVLELHEMITELRRITSAPPARQRANEGYGRMTGHEGTISPFTCPDCHGTLWEINEGGELRYECRVGHSFSTGVLLEALGEGVENALWAAVKTLQERADLAEKLASRASETASTRSREYFEGVARQARLNSKTLHEALLAGRMVTIPGSDRESLPTEQPPTPG